MMVSLRDRYLLDIAYLIVQSPARSGYAGVEAMAKNRYLAGPRIKYNIF
jgi:hypothetical protein